MRYEYALSFVSGHRMAAGNQAADTKGIANGRALPSERGRNANGLKAH
jgi:hypothetical protein